MHIFYFGRYWNEIDYIIDLTKIGRLAHKVNFTGSELQKHGTRPRSDYLEFYEGHMLQKLSMNNALDEFYQLATSNKILETNTANLIRTDLSFITLKTFLGQRSKIRNPAKTLSVQRPFDNVPTEISKGKEENFQDKFLNFISTSTFDFMLDISKFRKQTRTLSR